MTMLQDMRGLFFVIKGQYRKGVEPSFHNTARGDVSYIGGYDPTSPHTEEWYMVLDSKTYYCISCGGDLNRVLRGVYNTIRKCKGVAKKYFRSVSQVTSDDYYEVTYLGRRPLTPEERMKKAVGKCPRVSPMMRCVYEKVYEEYGDHFRDLIEEVEDLAYKDIKEDTPLNKSRKIMSKHKKTLVIEPKKEVTPIEPPRKLVRPKTKLGIKKLKI